jgi:hypothetical protein
MRVLRVRKRWRCEGGDEKTGDRSRDHLESHGGYRGKDSSSRVATLAGDWARSRSVSRLTPLCEARSRSGIRRWVIAVIVRRLPNSAERDVEGCVRSP